MRMVELGSTGLEMPNLIAGMMRIADKSDAEIRALYDAAREVGIDFFDHADIYGYGSGGWHTSERRFAEALGLSRAERAEIVLQSKAGIRIDEGYYDSSYEHLVASVEGSLRALGTDYLDVLLIHRPDALVQPEEVARAFEHLQSSGKVRAFGVSNHTPRQIDLLRTAVTQPIVVNQVQLSLGHAGILAQGLAANVTRDDALVRDGGGIVDHARANGITLQAWSPLQGDAGLLVDPDAYPELNAELGRLAAACGMSPSAIALAWIGRHPAGIQAVLGTTNAARLRESAAGSDVVLTRADWYRLLRAAGHLLP